MIDLSKIDVESIDYEQKGNDLMDWVVSAPLNSILFIQLSKEEAETVKNGMKLLYREGRKLQGTKEDIPTLYKFTQLTSILPRTVGLDIDERELQKRILKNRHGR